MRRDAAVFAIALLVQLGGLAVLLYGEETGIQAAVLGGGIVVLVGFGIMTGTIAMIEDPEEPEEHGA